MCVEVGGCLTGEHGVGVEKRELMGVQFTVPEIDQQRRIKSAFDPQWLLNPNKVFPLLDDGPRPRRMSQALAPDTESGIAAIVAEAASRGEPLAVAGNGTKAGMLRPVQAARSL